MRQIFALLLLLAPSLQQNASGPDPSIVISSIQVSTSPLFVTKPKNKTKPVAGECRERFFQVNKKLIVCVRAKRHVGPHPARRERPTWTAQ
jgi:hypothetical protein